MEGFKDEDIFYLNKIFKHKEGLVLAFNTLINKCYSDSEIFKDVVSNFDKLKENILSHDLNKMSNIKLFESYRSRNMKSVFDSDDVINGIPKALLNHRETNEHHFDYWKKLDTKMPKYALLECACDWFSVSLVEPHRGNSLEWWSSVEDDMIKEFGDYVDFEYIIKVVSLMMGV